MTRQKILIITHSRDNECVANVTRFLEEKNAEVIRFDVDYYPTGASLSTLFKDGRLQILLQVGDKTIHLEDITAAWFRRAYRVGHELNTILDKEYLPATIGEVKHTLFGMIEGLECFQLGRPSLYRRLDSKEMQLKVAVACGLQIPATCISNDPAQVKAFIQSLGKPAISKMQSSFAIYRDDTEHVVFTNEVSPDDLGDVDSVQYCPMTFQEKIEKKLELRITIAGNDVYAFSIDSQKEDNAKTDWRKEGVTLINQWQPYTLPSAVEQSLLQLMDKLGLLYGAIDVIVTPDDQYYFLEVNAAGEFFWIDRLCEHKISESIAHLLLNKGK